MKAQTETQKAIESGPLERLFNGTAPAKILDFLTVFRDYDYSKMDIAKNSGVSFRHALREIEKLEQLSLIKQTRTVGHAQMYKLNEAVKEMETPFRSAEHFINSQINDFVAKYEEYKKQQ